uniref:Uncharacterized protein n=1 Tax=Anguilla anguilla TaxID=7936 RepID=A0A0E9UWF0_ANGAN
MQASKPYVNLTPVLNMKIRERVVSTKEIPENLFWIFMIGIPSGTSSIPSTLRWNASF